MLALDCFWHLTAKSSINVINVFWEEETIFYTKLIWNSVKTLVGLGDFFNFLQTMC